MRGRGLGVCMEGGMHGWGCAHGGGGVCVAGGMCGRGMHGRGACMAEGQPTGMHSCLENANTKYQHNYLFP